MATSTSPPSPDFADYVENVQHGKYGVWNVSADDNAYDEMDQTEELIHVGRLEHSTHCQGRFEYEEVDLYKQGYECDGCHGRADAGTVPEDAVL